MIDNEPLKNILATATDFSTVCEIYAADTVPTLDGFDPNEAIGCFAAADGIEFMGVEYQRLVQSFGSINRTIGKEVNSTSVTFSNLSRYIADFEFNGGGFEGLIMVVRLISRGMSVSLATSMVMFAGRCEKPEGGSSESLTVKAKFILGGLDPVIPRRKYTPDDQDGRPASDPEFEGFIFIPRYGSTSFVRTVKKGGFLGWWNKKQVRSTIQWSNYSDLDANRPVTVVLGRAQIQSVLIGAVDVGTALQSVNAFCEGEIEDFLNVRSVDSSFPLSGTNYSEHLGLTGTANGNNPGYVADGYYSKTALVRVDVLNSAVDENDPPPDIVGVVLGNLMATPDSGGVWSGADWSNNPADHVRFLLTHPSYFNLDEAWIDDATFYAAHQYNAELIFDMSLSDFLYVEAG